MIPKRFKAEDAVKVFGDFADAMESAPLDRVFNQIVPRIHDAIADNFIRTRNSSSQVWPPHAPATVARYGPHPLLILSGKMLRAATTRGADGQTENIGPRDLRLGLTVPYAKYQQFGTSRIPAREFYYVHEEKLDSIREPFEDLCFEFLVGR